MNWRRILARYLGPSVSADEVEVDQSRRSFLRLAAGAAAAVAASQVIPLNRVWSFPKEIVTVGVDLASPSADFTVVSVAGGNTFLNTTYISLETLQLLKANLKVAEYFHTPWERSFARKLPVGGPVTVRLPMQFDSAAHFALGDHFTIEGITRPARPVAHLFPS